MLVDIARPMEGFIDKDACGVHFSPRKLQTCEIDWPSIGVRRPSEESLDPQRVQAAKTQGLDTTATVTSCPILTSDFLWCKTHLPCLRPVPSYWGTQILVWPWSEKPQPQPILLVQPEMKPQPQPVLLVQPEVDFPIL